MCTALCVENDELLRFQCTVQTLIAITFYQSIHSTFTVSTELAYEKLCT